MKRLILLFTLLAALPGQSWGAAYTASVTGNWSNQDTWGGSGPPGTGDTVTINSGVIVTLDSPVTVGATTIRGKLIVNANLTMEGTLTVGYETGSGELTFGPGVTIALGANNLELNSCYLTSTATSGNWAKVTGSGNVQNGTTSGYPPYQKQNINLSYVSFQNTGSLTFNIGSSIGSLTKGLALSHVVFTGQSTIDLGCQYMEKTTPVSISNCDFQGCNDIQFWHALNTTAPSNTSVTNNVFYHATAGTLETEGYAQVDISGNIFIRFKWFDANAVPIFSNNIFLQASDILGVYSHKGSVDIQNNYFYTNVSNPHIIVNNSSGTAADPQMIVAGNVFENLDGGADNIVITKAGVSFRRNLIIGAGKSLSFPATYTYGDYLVERNTYIPTGEDGVALFFSHGTATMASSVVRSNLTAGLDKKAIYASEANQTIGYSGYNNWYGVTVPYQTSPYTMTISDGTSNDLSPAVDPHFEDATRKFINHYAYATGQAADEANAIAWWRGRNGFDSGTGLQGAAGSHTPADLVTWVRAGFVPHNIALDGTGYNGDDIGAMDYAPAASGAKGAKFLALNWGME